MPAALVLEAVAAAVSRQPLYSLEAEFEALPIAAARKLGLPPEWVAKFEAHNPAHRQVLAVARVAAGSRGRAACCGRATCCSRSTARSLNRFREVERATQAPQVQLTVLRDGAELQPRCRDHGAARRGYRPPAAVGRRRAACAASRDGHPARIPPEGVFVAYFSYGSPATRYRLFAGRRIVEVDGQPTPDLDAFIAAVPGREDRSSVRLKTVTWNGSTDVTTLKLDQNYWPTYELRRTRQGWERHAHSLTCAPRGPC